MPGQPTQQPRVFSGLGAPYNFFPAPNAVVSPGSEGLTFENPFGLPPFALFNGIAAGFSPNPIQPPQIFANLAVPVAGIGGLQAGQLFTLPLSNPDDAESEG